MISLSLIRDVFGVFRSVRGDDASRRAFQPRCDGRKHAGTERLVHVKVTGLAAHVKAAQPSRRQTTRLGNTYTKAGDKVGDVTGTSHFMRRLNR